MVQRSLHGIVLRITTRYNNDFPYDVDIEEIHSDGEIASNRTILRYLFKGGFAVDLFMNLKEFLKFSFILVPDVGTYNFSLAEEKSIDLFLGSYSLYYDRAKVVDPTFVTGQSRILAFLNHDFEGSNQNLLSLPFSRTLWCGILLMLTLTFLVVGFIGWIEKVPQSDNSFHFISIILQKAYPIKFVKPSCRVAFLVISASIVMFMVYYTSNMVSMKSVTRFALNSLESIVNSDYQILFDLQLHHSIRLMLEALYHMPIIAMLLKRIGDAKFEYQSFGKNIQEVSQHPSVYIIDEETGISTIEKEIGAFPCTWSTVPVYNLKYPWAMFMRKKSTFRNSVNYGLLRLDESGLTKRIRQKWVPHTNECKGNAQAFESISIRQVHYAFLILATGAMIAIVWLILVENRCLIRKSNLDRRFASFNLK